MGGVDDELLQETERIRRRLKEAGDALDQFVDQLTELTAQLVRDTGGGGRNDDAAASPG